MCLFLSLIFALPARTQPAAPNVAPIVVRTPHGGFNRLVVSITVCAPTTDRCATIDDVMLDTGSTGLRLEASAVPAALMLPSFRGPTGQPLAECLRFVADAAWGPLLRADIRIGGMTAPDLPIQIIDDSRRAPPANCPRSDVHPTSNGTLGIGPNRTDCDGTCEQSPFSPRFFACGLDRCTPLEGAVEPAYRLPNPVSRFARHNNGVMFEFAAVPGPGAREAAGTLTFGVGTSDNNGLGGADIIPLDRRGRFTTSYAGIAYPNSYLDSGTETYVVPDASLPLCETIAGAFCVSPERELNATLTGRNGSHVNATFTVGDYQAIRERNLGATASAAVPQISGSRAFVWGAPFFLGRRILVVLDGASVPSSHDTGPFYAIGKAGAP